MRLITRSFRLGSLFGIEIYIAYSWFIVFFLVAWSLAAGYFPLAFAELGASARWLLGFLTSALFFLSVLAHELGHSLYAQAKNLHIRRITLFIFGGAAEIVDEPERPLTEFIMAAAGPLVSFMLAAVSFVFYIVNALSLGSVALAAVLGTVAIVNVVVGVFNLLPGYPLDGGRILRAGLWWWTGSVERATRIASRFGRGFGYLLIFLGMLQIVFGAFINGLWLILIGWFLGNAASISYAQVALRQRLRGLPAAQIMEPFVLTPDVDTPAAELLKKLTPAAERLGVAAVTKNGKYGGLLELNRLRNAARDATVGDLILPAAETTTLQVGADAVRALNLLLRGATEQVVVLDGEHPVGVVSRRTLKVLVVRQQS